MKKVLYSGFIKFLALLLIGFMAVNAAALVVNTSSEYYYSGDAFIYAFEENYMRSRHFNADLESPSRALMTALYEQTEFYIVSDYNDPIAAEYAVIEPAAKPMPSAADIKAEVSRLAAKVFSQYKDSEKIDYYALINGESFTNCGAESPQDLSGSFRCVSRYQGDGRMELIYSNGNNRYHHYGNDLAEGIEFEIHTVIKESYAEELRPVWEKQATDVEQLIFNIGYCVIIALLSFFFLAIVWGRREGDPRELWFDRIWTELWLAAAPLIAFAAAGLIFFALESFYSASLPLYICRWICYAAAALGLPLTCICLLELLKKLKHRRFLADSVCWRLIRWGWALAWKILGWCWGLAKSFLRALVELLRGIKRLWSGDGSKTGRILLAMLVIYSFALWLFAILTPNSPFFLLLTVLLLGFAAFVLLHRAKDLDAIKSALRSVRAGELAAKLPEIKSEDLKKTASDIEEIAAGLESSLAQRIKAERTKTELITNVSHDLKTPLTSIISYTELLSQVEGLPEEARDYVAVIGRKSEKLKILTEDLFSISKVQSGAEEIKMERLNAALLIEQAMAERDNEISAAPLSFCLELDKELHIVADGRKMSRVLGNLIDNILKYSLSGTRVFITARRSGDEAIMELKNISSYLMDFDDEEICARFVRADEARSDGGSGLGLAIARSFTQACGGDFRVVTDGDLFKAVISFKAI